MSFEMQKRVVCFVLCCLCLAVNPLDAQPRSLRSDITIRSLATLGRNTVRVRRDPASGNLYVVQNNGIIQRADIAANGTATLTTVYRTSDHGLNAPLGIAFGQDGTMYLVGNDSTGQFGTATIVKGVPASPGSENRTWSVIATTVAYPYGNIYNHRMSGIIVSRSGDSLYVNSGAATDHGEMHGGYREVGLTSIILKLPVDADSIVLQDDREWLRTNGYLFAEGIRNTFDLAYGPNGDLFGPENSDDRDDPEELNWLQEGHHYGFPWKIGGDNTPQQYAPYDPHTDPLLSPNAWGGGQLYVTYSNDPSYPPRPDSVAFTEPIASVGPDADKFRDTVTGDIQDASQLGMSIPTFTPHRSVDGIVFDDDSILAGDLRGGAFVISFSNSSLITALGDTSQDLMHIALTKTGDMYTARVTRLVSGFNSPLGLEMVGNKFYVAETGLQGSNSSPKLWEITLPQNVTGVTGSQGNIVPGIFNLGQNYPNPFNPKTVISYQLPVMSKVNLKIYDILGREVETLVNEVKQAGSYSVRWNALGMPSGVYFYRLVATTVSSGHAGSFVETRKLVLLR
jgi:hypothetical protein